MTAYEHRGERMRDVHNILGVVFEAGGGKTLLFFKRATHASRCLH